MRFVDLRELSNYISQLKGLSQEKNQLKGESHEIQTGLWRTLPIAYLYMERILLRVMLTYSIFTVTKTVGFFSTNTLPTFIIENKNVYTPSEIVAVPDSVGLVPGLIWPDPGDNRFEKAEM